VTPARHRALIEGLILAMHPGLMPVAEDVHSIAQQVLAFPSPRELIALLTEAVRLAEIGRRHDAGHRGDV
jgi:hypothetical protein